MLQTAVFVDAGYLFAAGSALLWGEKKPRHTVTLDANMIVESLAETASKVEKNARLLRIYWYDGISPNRGPSPEQSALAQSSNVKLRLGFLNSQGQQKGVDSLIVTDLIDLARNKAISDAVILAGDEDLRVGVQVAQTYGVRVHLLGVKPSRGNQSFTLVQEVDEVIEWAEVDIGKALALRPDRKESETKSQSEKSVRGADETLDFVGLSKAILTRFNDIQLQNNRAFLEANRSLPREVDSPLLATARDGIGRDLAQDEKRQLRAAMITLLRETD